AVPVLPLDGEPAAPATELDGDDRSHRPGEPPVRPDRLLDGRRRQEHACGELPQAPAYQDGHAGYSDPLDEQQFLVDTINRLEKTDYWHDTAVVILYDDSDGWYDHQMGPIVNQSSDPSVDALTGTTCGSVAADVFGGYQDRCGYGPRQPLLVISHWAKSNFVDDTVTDQTSVLRFIEDNWQLGRIGNFSLDVKAGPLDNLFDFKHPGKTDKLFLDPVTGEKK